MQLSTVHDALKRINIEAEEQRESNYFLF